MTLDSYQWEGIDVIHFCGADGDQVFIIFGQFKAELMIPPMLKLF